MQMCFVLSCNRQGLTTCVSTLQYVNRGKFPALEIYVPFTNKSGCFYATSWTFDNCDMMQFQLIQWLHCWSWLFSVFLTIRTYLHWHSAIVGRYPFSVCVDLKCRNSLNLYVTNCILHILGNWCRWSCGAGHGCWRSKAFSKEANLKFQFAVIAFFSSSAAWVWLWYGRCLEDDSGFKDLYVCLKTYAACYHDRQCQ